MSNLVPIKSTQFVHLEGQSSGTSFNINNIAYYLPRTINQLTKLVGNDVVLRGMDLSIALDESSNTLTATIGPGVFIIDQTLIESLFTNIVNLDSTDSYITDGNFVVYVQFQYLQTVNTNPVRYGLTFVNSSGGCSESWDHNKNRLVLNYYKYNSTDKTITTDNEDFILIENKEYYRLGYNPNTMTLSTYMMNFLKMAGVSGQSSETGNNVIDGDFQVLGKLTVGNSVNLHNALNVDSTATFNADVHIKDDVQIYGDRFLANSTDVQFGAQEIILNRNQLNGYGTPNRYSGLKISRGLESPAILFYDEEYDRWMIGTEEQNFAISPSDDGSTLKLNHDDILDWVQQITVDFNTFFEAKTTDDLQQGKNNLYFNEQTLYSQLYNILKSGSGILLDTTTAGSIKIIAKPATASTLGSIIVGSNLSIDSTGKLAADLQSEENFTTELKTKLENLISPTLPDVLPATMIQTDADHRFITDDQLDKLDSLTLYVLPKASRTVLGGVLIGDNIDVDLTGRISVPIATSAIPGLIKPGTNLSVDSTGTLNFTGSISSNIEVATKDSLGIVKPGDNINIDDTGEISIPVATVDNPGVIKPGDNLVIYTDGTLSSPIATKTKNGVVRIGSNIDVDLTGNISVPISTDTIPGLVKPGTNLEVTSDGTLNVLGGAGVVNPATKDSLGVVIPGDNISVDDAGKISVAVATNGTPGIITADTTYFDIEDGVLKFNTVIPEITDFTLTPNIAVKGSTIDTIRLSWTTNYTPSRITINDTINIDNSATHVNLSNLTITEDTDYNLKVYGLLSKDESYNKLSFCNYTFYGNSLESDIGKVNLLNLNNSILLTDIYNYQINAISITGYFYLAYPKSLGRCDFDFDKTIYGGLEDPYILPFTNSYNYTELYYIYRTTRLNLGTFSFTIIKEL